MQNTEAKKMKLMPIKTVHDLPLEIFIDVLLRLDGMTVGACRRVCKRWKNIIDDSDYLWEKISRNAFPYASRIAEEKRHTACRWYHIHKNLVKWSKIQFSSYNTNCIDLGFPVDEFMNIVNRGEPRCLNIFKYQLRFANNSYALVLFYNYNLCIVRPVDNAEYQSEKHFEAMGFSLCKDRLYFYYCSDIFVCDLLAPELESTRIHHCDYKIKHIQHVDGKTFVFTVCGKIMTLCGGKVEAVKPSNLPPQWMDQVRTIHAINDNNYIFYSRDLFFVETDKHKHLYLEFRPVSALFFYEDNVIIGDRSGWIWVYRPSDQKYGKRSKMERVCCLPEQQHAVDIQVFERQTGPIIIVITLEKIFLVDVKFFPTEEVDTEMILPINRILMYKKLVENRKMLKREDTDSVLQSSTE